jgi:hypothetical protein
MWSFRLTTVIQSVLCRKNHDFWWSGHSSKTVSATSLRCCSFSSLLSLPLPNESWETLGRACGGTQAGNPWGRELTKLHFNKKKKKKRKVGKTAWGWLTQRPRCVCPWGSSRERRRPFIVSWEQWETEVKKMEVTKNPRGQSVLRHLNINKAKGTLERAL